MAPWQSSGCPFALPTRVPHQPRAPSTLAATLTTPEPRFIQTMVREGFPVQAQLKTASEPRSTRRDCGSVAILGPTVQRRPALPQARDCATQKPPNHRGLGAARSRGRSPHTHRPQPHKSPQCPQAPKTGACCSPGKAKCPRSPQGCGRQEESMAPPKEPLQSQSCNGAQQVLVIPGFLELPQEAHVPFPFIFSSSAGPGKAASSWQTTYSRRPRSC